MPLQVTPRVRTYEAYSDLIPAPGVSLEQALADAQVTGFKKMRRMPDGSVRFYWHLAPRHVRITRFLVRHLLRRSTD